MSNTQKAAVMCIFCFCTSSGLALAADAIPVVGQIDLNSLTGEAWYRASLLGAPVGYLHTNASVVDNGAGPRLRTVEEMLLKIDFGNGPLSITANNEIEYGPDLRPAYHRSEQDEFGRAKIIEARRQGNQLHVKTIAGGVPREKTLTVSETFGSELILSVASSQGKLPDHAEYVFQSFVPELEMLVDFTVTCSGREMIEAGGQQVEALKIIFAATSIGLEMNWWVDERGEMIRQTIPSMMNLLLEKVTQEEAMASLTPLAISDHIAVEKRMGNARRLTYVHLTGDSDGIPAADLVPNGPLQKVVATGPQTAQIVVQAETDEGLAGLSFPFSGPHLAEYLEPTDIIQSGDPAIVAKAREIVGDETDAWAAAQKLTKWVYANMGKVDHDPQPYTAIECLTLMKGDCSEHSTLLCALSRAVGIPSKFVTGVIYMDNGQDRGYFYHAWNELYVGRWVSVDATWGETTSNAGHLTLASGSLTSESFAQTNLSSVRSMGVLKLEVADFKTN